MIVIFFLIISNISISIVGSPKHEWFDALKTRDVEKVKEFLDSEAKIGSINKMYECTIERTINNRVEKTVKQLNYPFMLFVDADPYFNKEDRDKILLHIISNYMSKDCKENNRVNYIDPNKTVDSGYLISFITYYSDAKVLDYFLKNTEANVNRVSMTKLSPLFLAATIPNYEKIEIIFENGGSILDDDVYPTLAYTYYTGNIDLLKLLSKKGVDINMKRDGIYLSSYAAAAEKRDMVETILAGNICYHNKKDINILKLQKLVASGFFRFTGHAIDAFAPTSIATSIFSDMLKEQARACLSFSFEEQTRVKAAQFFHKTFIAGEWIKKISIKDDPKACKKIITASKILFNTSKKYRNSDWYRDLRSFINRYGKLKYEEIDYDIKLKLYEEYTSVLDSRRSNRVEATKLIIKESTIKTMKTKYIDNVGICLEIKDILLNDLDISEYISMGFGLSTKDEFLILKDHYNVNNDETVWLISGDNNFLQDIPCYIKSNFTYLPKDYGNKINCILIMPGEDDTEDIN
jgi:hypothetical protein